MVAKPDSHSIYVRSRNGMLRRVDISSASVSYGEAVPQEQRTAPAASALQPGVEIRVTAEQDSSGEWRATQIQITAASGRSPDMTPQQPDQPEATPDPDEQQQPGATPVITLSADSWTA
jgi:hypothetical protein